MEDESHYAPALRTTAEKILKEFELVCSQKFFTEIFGTMTGIAAVIDQNRQIVYANNEFLSLLGIHSLESVLGKRPGEVVSCVHSAEEPSGCGTTRACAYCGVVNAILESQDTGKKSTREARITAVTDEKFKSWDFNVISTPISFSGELFYVLVLQDISDLKRRAALERIFYHDLLNSVGGLNGLLTVLKEGVNKEEAAELINLSEESSRNIIEAILIQRDIRAAEKGELIVNIEITNSTEVLDSAIGKIGFHEAAKDRKIIKAHDSVSTNFETDMNLLQRVLVNLLKNALEATDPAGTVTTGITNADDKINFWVKNSEVMPEEVKMQLFQRSFTTKGEGRGIGTYSIRLLTENYLNGKVSFISNNTDGTVFNVELNKKFSANSPD
jgi:nitrogen fixation/metabolism regulation signal transduction histidine kinase